AEAILALGPQAVLVKGGHLEGEADAVDVLVDEAGERVFRAERIATRHTHGTGRTLARAIAANHAKGYVLPAAVDRAKRYLTEAIRHVLPLGGGHGPTRHLSFPRGSRFFTWVPSERPRILRAIARSAVRLVPVSQLDRASDYGSEGRGFESSRALYQKGPLRRAEPLFRFPPRGEQRRREAGQGASAVMSWGSWCYGLATGSRSSVGVANTDGPCQSTASSARYTSPSPRTVSRGLRTMLLAG